MKIVIDIPAEVYKSIRDNDCCGIMDMYNAIRNGTPIIQGHWITYTYNESNGCDCWGRPEYETIIEHECSYCHGKIITSKIKVYNYCPFCGAKMKSGEE